jgi:hypothetical protein
MDGEGAGVNKSLDQLLGRFDRSAFQREVDAELQFHIEMQARDYEREGLTPEEALTKAGQRFGDFAQIKTQCVQIGSQNNARTWAMKILFTIAFLLGVLIRSLNSDYHMTRMGGVLIMIAVFGGLLLMGKRIRVEDFMPAPEPLRLGLRRGPDPLPRAFDEKGRTPFERVQADD